MDIQILDSQGEGDSKIYTVKVPIAYTDEFGTSAVGLYGKEYSNRASLVVKNMQLQAQIDANNDRISLIDSYEA